MSGTPIFFRVHPLGGSPIEDMAKQDGAGHYTATFLMPAHGIVSVEAGVRGESCESGTCQPSDLMLAVTGPQGGDIFGTGGVAQTPVDPAAAQRPSGGASTSSSGTTTSIPVLPIALLGAVAIAGALVGGAIAIRRTARPI